MDPTKPPVPTGVNEGTAPTDDPAVQVPPISYLQMEQDRPTGGNLLSAEKAAKKASILQGATDDTGEKDGPSRDDADSYFDSSENEDVDCTTCGNGQHGPYCRMSIKAAVEAWEATSFAKGSATGCPGPQTTEETAAPAETASFGVEGLFPFIPPRFDWSSPEGNASFKDGAAELFQLDMGEGK
jgi:hypothetical protein